MWCGVGVDDDVTPPVGGAGEGEGTWAVGTRAVDTREVDTREVDTWAVDTRAEARRVTRAGPMTTCVRSVPKVVMCVVVSLLGMDVCIGCP